MSSEGTKRSGQQNTIHVRNNTGESSALAMEKEKWDCVELKKT